jgi:hypothetical protein
VELPKLNGQGFSLTNDFAHFLDDGRICLTNNCAERALRGIALGRRNWTFAGSQRGADRAAIMLTMITTCRHNDVDPKAWLAGVLTWIADLPASRLHELLPGNGSSCARPASPPINRPPDLGRHHETLRARAQASIRRPSSYAYFKAAKVSAMGGHAWSVILERNA